MKLSNQPFSCKTLLTFQGKQKVRAKRKKRKLSIFELQLQRNYGITRDELDVILTQLSQQYNCQWSVISTVLLREHGIRMNDMSIRDRYTTYLDPTIKKQSYTPEQQIQLARMFWVEGKNYSDLKRALGNHGRGAIKKCLGSIVRRGIKRLQLYLYYEILLLPQSEHLGNGFLKRYNLVNAICSESSFRWENYKYSYLLLYYFIVNEGIQLERIPKQLAMILYKRLIEMSDIRQKQKKQFYSKVDPKLFTYIQQNSEIKRKNYMKSYQRISEYGNEGSGSVEKDILKSHNVSENEKVQEDVNLDMFNIDSSIMSEQLHGLDEDEKEEREVEDYNLSELNEVLSIEDINDADLLDQ